MLATKLQPRRSDVPVTATPTARPRLTQDDIRMFLRDVAGQVPGTGVENILFDAPEFSDDDIQRAIKFTVARFNVITPVSGDSQDTINIWLLLIGVSEFLMTSEAFRQQRATIAQLEAKRAELKARTGSVTSFQTDRELAQVEAQLAQAREALEELDRQASLKAVPRQWRQ